jgi:F-type H+-transporting ATPase subunit gamma
MEDLARIQARLESLGELAELVGALRSMSASRSREAHEALQGTGRYSAFVQRAISEISPLVSEVDWNDRVALRDDAVMLVITAENGFVGGFNNALIERALAVRQPDQRFVVVGRRGHIAASERGAVADDELSMINHRDGVSSLARRIGRKLSGVRSATLVFAPPLSGANFKIDVRQILPLERPWTDCASPLAAPLHHLPPAELLDGLAEEYLFAQVADALMESLASENSARLRAMDAASRNIDDRIEKLTRQERAARQEQTTSDMLDVVTGAEAVNGH